MIKNQPSNIPEEKGRINQQDFITTYDLGISSALLSANFELISMDKTNPKKVQFIFRRETGIEKVVDDYFADKLKIKARTFFDNIKAIKNKMYSNE